MPLSITYCWEQWEHWREFPICVPMSFCVPIPIVSSWCCKRMVFLCRSTVYCRTYMIISLQPNTVKQINLTYHWLKSVKGLFFARSPFGLQIMLILNLIVSLKLIHVVADKLPFLIHLQLSFIRFILILFLVHVFWLLIEHFNYFFLIRFFMNSWVFLRLIF